MNNLCPFSPGFCHLLTEFHLIRPFWLLALIPYALLLVLMLRNKLAQGNWTNLCDTALLPFLLQEKAINQNRLPLITASAAALLTIFALAGPTWNRLPSPAFRNVSALVIVLNLNSTMDAADIKPSRLIKARYKISDILKQRKDGQTALLVYAGDAFTVTPLTDDTNTIDSQLSALTTEIMPVQGNNTSLALEKAVELCKQAGLQKGQILLITDAVDMNNALDSVKKLGDFQLSVLGVGTNDGAPVALADGGFMKNSQGSIVVSKLDVDELATLAQAGHGIYQTITANDDDIRTLLTHFDKPVSMQSEDKSEVILDQWNDKGSWLLLLVIPLIAFSFRKGLICLAVLLLLPLPENSYAFEWQDLWQSRDRQGQQAYNDGKYEQAAQLFENQDWKAAAQYKAGKYEQAINSLKPEQTANSFYNQGNALAQSGQLDEALKAYKKALEKNPNDTDAKYNKDLVEKELEKQKQKQDKKQDNKQQQSKQDTSQNNQGGQSEQSEKGKNQDQNSDKQSSEKQQSPENQQQNEADKGNESKEQTEQKQHEKKEQTEEQLSKQKTEQAKNQAQQKAEEQKKQTDQQEKAISDQTAESQATEEMQQANKQWLKRIPDDPAGLLKRKFKYQYGQRNQSANEGAW